MQPGIVRALTCLIEHLRGRRLTGLHARRPPSFGAILNPNGVPAEGAPVTNATAAVLLRPLVCLSQSVRIWMKDDCHQRLIVIEVRLQVLCFGVFGNANDDTVCLRENRALAPVE